MSAGLGTRVLLCAVVFLSLDCCGVCGLNSVWDIKYLEFICNLKAYFNIFVHKDYFQQNQKMRTFGLKETRITNSNH